MKRRVVMLFLGVMVAAWGCGKSNPGSTQPSIPLGTTSDLLALVDQSFTPGAIVPTNVDSTVASLLYSLKVDSRSGASALFLQPSAVPLLLDAGDVTVAPVAAGSLALSRYQLNVTGFVQTVYTTFLSRPAGITLPFDGLTFHRFAVSGTSGVPAFTDSVQSVTAPAITAPAVSAVVDSAAALTVSWTPMAAGDSTVYVICEIQSQVDTTRYAAAVIARDVDGSTQVPQARLAPLPSGAARLSVARYRVRPLVAGGRPTALICEAATTRDVSMQ